LKRPNRAKRCCFAALRFTKPLQAASQCTSASIFDRLKWIDSAIETLRQERQTLIAQLEVLAREKDAE